VVTLDDVCFGSIEGPAGALRQLSTTPYREGDRRLVAGCFTAPYQGLSPVRGNLHAGFSGEGWTVRSAPYPTLPRGSSHSSPFTLTAIRPRLRPVSLSGVFIAAKSIDAGAMLIPYPGVTSNSSTFPLPAS